MSGPEMEAGFDGERWSRDYSGEEPQEPRDRVAILLDELGGDSVHWTSYRRDADTFIERLRGYGYQITPIAGDAAAGVTISHKLMHRIRDAVARSTLPSAMKTLDELDTAIAAAQEGDGNP